MPVTMQQVLAEIERDEPDYPAIALFGEEALPHLQMIIESQDPLKVAKATYAASLIGGQRAIDILEKSGEHHDAQVRVAAAHGLRNLSGSAPTDLVIRALGDADPGVRKLALGTAAVLNRSDFMQGVSSIEQSDPDMHLRETAKSVVRQLNSP